MPNKEESDHYTKADLALWLRQEVLDITKAAQLRIQDATDYVTAYALGQLTPEQAAERHRQYVRRWTDAIPGVYASETMTDQELIRRIDNRPQPDTGEKAPWVGR
jgi:hypothetical protein